MHSPDLHKPQGIRLARWIFILAGLYGVPVIASMFFITPTFMPKAPQQQPEIYYGFACAVFAWQIVFFLIASNPMRYRPLMLIAGLLEKLLFVAIVTTLMIRHIAGTHWAVPVAIDGAFGVAFLMAWWATRPTPQVSSA
jgi:hypothetical protein